jgi:hypothetical protein
MSCRLYRAHARDGLRQLYGEPRVIAKEPSRLDDQARAFVASSPFLLMASLGANRIPRGERRLGQAPAL